MADIPADAADRSEDQKAGADRPPKSRNTAAMRFAIILIVVVWTYLYNLLIKKQGLVESFFELLDTISDDFVMGTLITISVGLGIVVAFSVTKLYTQVIANVYSFRIIEDLVHADLRHGRYRQFMAKILRFEDQPLPASTCPKRRSWSSGFMKMKRSHRPSGTAWRPPPATGFIAVFAKTAGCWSPRAPTTSWPPRHRDR